MGWGDDIDRWERKSRRISKRTAKKKRQVHRANRPVRKAERLVDRAVASAINARQAEFQAQMELQRVARNRAYADSLVPTKRVVRDPSQSYQRASGEATWSSLLRDVERASVLAPIPAAKGAAVLAKAIKAATTGGRTASTTAKAVKATRAKDTAQRARVDRRIAAKATVRRGQKAQRRSVKGKKPKRRHTRPAEAGYIQAGGVVGGTGAGVGAVGIGSEEKARNAATLPAQLGIATVQDPGAVAKASAETLKNSLLGLPAAVHQMFTDPLQAWEDIKDDYEGRYGPLLEGDFDKFRKHVINRHGLTPYAFDALVAAPPAGRVLGAAARRGGLGSKAQSIATAPRRDLQVAPNRARPQELSPNLLGAAAQKSLDLIRAKRDRGVGDKRRGGRRPVVTGKGDDKRFSKDRPQLQGRQGTVAPLRTKRAMVRETAQDKGRALHAMQAEQLYEVHRGISKTARTRLSAAERKAAPVAIQLGIPGNPAVARQVLMQRIEMIQRERAARAEMDPDYKPPRGPQDNIPFFQELIAQADQAFTPRLEAFVKEQTARAAAAGEADPAIDRRQAQIRAATPQAALRGVETVPQRLEPARAELRRLQAEKREIRQGGGERPLAEAKAEISTLKQALENPNSPLRRQADRAFLEAAARSRGDLIEPGYMPSQMRMTAFAPFTVGGRRAIAGPKQYKGRLFDEGTEDLRIEALAAGVAQNIKRRYNWNLVADTFDSFAYSWSRGKDGQGMDLGALRKKIARQGYTENDVILWNPARFRKQTAPEGERLAEEIVGTTGLQDAITKSSASEFDAGSGWVAIPRAAYEEMSASAKQTFGGRLWDISVQKQSRILLGAANLPWLQFQVLSNGFLTGLAGATPFDAVAAQRWWSRLDDNQRKAVEPYIGLGAFQTDVRQTKIGAAAKSSTVNAWRALKETVGGQYIWRNFQVRDLNPFDAMFRADNAQNNFFRRTVFYNRVKRDAYKRMGESAGGAGMIQNNFLSAIGKMPDDQMVQKVLQDFPALERHAQHVNQMLGDYVTYTSKERAILKKSVMFYGFLRFSLRFAFWTMPTKHPVITGIMGNLSKLRAEETIEMLGGGELPFALGRIRFLDDKTFVDLARANPVTNSLVGVATAYGLDSKLFAATGMLPPIVGMAIGQIGQRDTFTGKPWLTEGAPMPRNKTDYSAEERGRILLSQSLSMFYPYRVWNDIAEGGVPVGHDSLAWDTRPTQYSENYKTKQEPAGERVLQETFPLGGLFFESLREMDRDPKWARVMREGRLAEQAQRDAAIAPEDDEWGSSSDWGSSSSSGWGSSGSDWGE